MAAQSFMLAAALRSAKSISPNAGMNSRNASSAGSIHPPISSKSPIAIESDMPTTELIRATRTYTGITSGMAYSKC